MSYKFVEQYCLLYFTEFFQKLKFTVVREIISRKVIPLKIYIYM